MRGRRDVPQQVVVKGFVLKRVFALLQRRMCGVAHYSDNTSGCSMASQQEEILRKVVYVRVGEPRLRCSCPSLQAGAVQDHRGFGLPETRRVLD